MLLGVAAPSPRLRASVTRLSALARRPLSSRSRVADPPACAQPVDGAVRVLTYNILSDAYYEPNPTLAAPRRKIKFENRVNCILAELDAANADILCLQEVEHRVYQSSLLPFLLSRGYHADFAPRGHAKKRFVPDSWIPRVDGNVLAHRTSRFTQLAYTCAELRELVFEKGQSKWGIAQDTLRYMLGCDQNVSVSILQPMSGGARLCAANIHATFGGRRDGVNEIQVQLALHAIRKCILTHFGLDARSAPPDHVEPIPIVFAGDFNCTVGSGSYQLLAEGVLPRHSDWLKRYGEPVIDRDLTHSLGLKSAYAASSLGEPACTWYGNQHVHSTLDYIWFTPSLLDLLQLRRLPTEKLKQYRQLPMGEFPSDHLALVADFALKS